MNEEVKDLIEKLARLERKFDVLLSIIVVQQKTACEAMGVHPDTVKAKAKRGEVEILSGEGSRLNYLTLTEASKLKKRSKRR